MDGLLILCLVLSLTRTLATTAQAEVKLDDDQNIDNRNSTATSTTSSRRRSSEYEALMAFKEKAIAIAATEGRTRGPSSLPLQSWSPLNPNPCSGEWEGVRCGHRGRVACLVLDGEHLEGPTAMASLASLTHLRVLSITHTRLNGSIPSSLGLMRRLGILYLSSNRFSGSIPSSFAESSTLVRLDLSGNELSGAIPPGLMSIRSLITLRLERNSFSGGLQVGNSSIVSVLRDFNVSFNMLEGSIPGSLSAFPASSFWGNHLLCGYPLLSCSSNNVNTVDGRRKQVIIAIATTLTLSLIIIVATFLLYFAKRLTVAMMKRPSIESGQKPLISLQTCSAHASPPQNNKAVIEFVGFPAPDRPPFQLEDLLSASAEMLGRGTLGTAYKALLPDGSAVAVKRLKDVGCKSKSEFRQLMEFIGNKSHPNLVPLKGFYYADDDKLILYEYMPNGSLFFLLHGNRGPGRRILDWALRLKIALDAARGLAFIHRHKKAQKIPHGNIKSLNILLDEGGNARISDFGLVMMMSSSWVSGQMLGGYRAPEQRPDNGGKPAKKLLSQRADVYSFGVLLLELLTGKAPAQSRIQEHGNVGDVDLVKWVQSVVREEWTSEVFDIEIIGYKNTEEEMVCMLQIALACVAESPQARPNMSQVVKMIQNIDGDYLASDDQSSLDSASLTSSSLSLSEGNI